MLGSFILEVPKTMSSVVVANQVLHLAGRMYPRDVCGFVFNIGTALHT